MKLIEFIKRFPNEAACKKHPKAFREKQGIVCSRSGCIHNYWKGHRNQWEFCYWFNRRNMDIFYRLMVAGASYQNTFNIEITAEWLPDALHN